MTETPPETGPALTQARRFQRFMEQNGVRRFQAFLNQNGFDCGLEDGWAGQRTQDAIKGFQQAKDRAPTGVLDVDTFLAAYQMDRDLAPEHFFKIGPDHEPGQADLRQTRPYFVIQLDDPDALECQADRVRRWVRKAQLQPGSLQLRLSDVSGTAALAQRLRPPAAPPPADAPPSPFAHLRGLLACDTVRLLETLPDDAGPELPPPLRVRLVSELNALMQESCLFSKDVFPGGTVEQTVEAMKALYRAAAQEAEVSPDEVSEKVEALAPTWAEALGDATAAAGLTGRPLLLVNRLLLQIALNADGAGHLAPIQVKGPVTDVYLLSHGWHRNFFRAIWAYDQIFSRMSILMHRQRLTATVPYHPLFLAVHWHSDPGEDAWVDGDGRRHKASFMQNVEAVFERPTAAAEWHVPPSQRFSAVFEDLYQFFSRLSLPDLDALGDCKCGEQTAPFARALDAFSLRETADADEADKICVAWSCYFQAQAKGQLSGQTQKPTHTLTPAQARLNLLRFFASVLGVGVLLGLLRLWPFNLLSKEVNGLFGHWFGDFAGLVGVALVLAVVAVGSFLGKGFLVSRGRIAPEDKPHRKVPLSHVLAWAPLQLWYGVPAVAHLFRFYLSREPHPEPPRKGLFDERLGARGRDVQPGDDDLTAVLQGRAAPSASARRNVRDFQKTYTLAARARYPVRLLRASLHKNNPGLPQAALVDAQCDFFEMQIAGTQAGRHAADFLERLLNGDDVREAGAPRRAVFRARPRLHFLGHSFGGLVIMNALRSLAYKPRTEEAKPVSTVCLLEGAIASDWLEGEPALADAVGGAIACVYSAYDTANGFYYPVSNRGRQAAGFVGLTAVGDKSRDVRTLGQQGEFASLVEPPDLREWLDASLYRAVQTARAHARAEGKSEEEIAEAGAEAAKGAPSAPKPYLVNLDASRIIYEGPKSAGGGHGDIFKDDVVHLCWAVTRLGQPYQGAAAAAGNAAPITPSEK